MKALEDELTAIAGKHLGFETLEERKADSLDFREVSCWGVKAALLEAYRLGRDAGGQK